MYKEHYILKNFSVRLSADVCVDPNDVTLIVWMKNSVGLDEIIFACKFSDKIAAYTVLKGFGHCYEYQGVRWERIS